jgi:acetyl-CoA synthase
MTGSSAPGDGYLNGPIDDIQLRSWGIQLVDGRMPGFAAIVGAAKSNEVAVKIVRELQQRNILVFLSGNVNGRSIIHQLQEEGVEMGYDTYIVPFGLDTLSAIYALGFAARSALTFGGMKGGQWRDILLYNKFRVFAFVLALGEVDDLKYAAAAGAISYGFPVIADTVIPQILPSGVTRYMTWSGPKSWCKRPSRCGASRSRSPRCLSRSRMALHSRVRWCARPTCGSNSAANTPAVSSSCAWSRWMRWKTARSP